MEDMRVSLNVKSETVISNIFHKACVEIDEVGTEAAAITVSVSRGCSLYELEKVNFVADHPFLFMIKEEVSGLVIFTALSYQKLLSRVYNAESKVVDFQNKADEVVNEVNSWAKVASRGLISNILNPKSLSPDISIILANGLYFKGTWFIEFDAKYTKNRDFYLLNGDTVSVPFMTNDRDKYLYKSFEGFKVLKISYLSGNGKATLNTQFVMYLFPPDARDGLHDLVKEFESNPRFLQQDLGLNLDLVKLDEIWIPKFKFSYDFDVCDAMQDMGYSLPFSENLTDFAKMIHFPKGIPFFVSNMFHKAFIEVDEKGTEAATFSMLSGCAMRQIEHSSFIADHPSIFIIKEEMSGLVLFTGAVVNLI
ncbi:Serpin-Z4 [Camellia lanceoleosa]|uniref:Serpin-Z4 n=1 Tax=Camellia lanceoleosa TaxID=1840588 RepID=A0ACC0HQT7_9ERIC|nr:Serpin-Z4 [Camellia lanceoleosa]